MNCCFICIVHGTRSQTSLQIFYPTFTQIRIPSDAEKFPAWPNCGLNPISVFSAQLIKSEAISPPLTFITYRYSRLSESLKSLFCLIASRNDIAYVQVQFVVNMFVFVQDGWMRQQNQVQGKVSNQQSCSKGGWVGNHVTFTRSHDLTA